MTCHDEAKTILQLKPLQGHNESRTVSKRFYPKYWSHKFSIVITQFQLMIGICVILQKSLV